MRDSYLGYAIDYSAYRESYRVMAEDEVVYETVSYDAACVWIEDNHRHFANVDNFA